MYILSNMYVCSHFRFRADGDLRVYMQDGHAAIHQVCVFAGRSSISVAMQIVASLIDHGAELRATVKVYLISRNPYASNN